MMYYFDNFRFDNKHLTLYKNEETVSIRYNEARVLALLLSDPNQVFSKDTILNIVWSDKVVSEQAVFQNISSLRAIIGDKAIRTFSRRGYQWQCPLKEVPSNQQLSLASVNSSQPLDAQTSDHTLLNDALPTSSLSTAPSRLTRKFSTTSAAVFSLLMAVFTIYTVTTLANDNAQTPFAISVLPFSVDSLSDDIQVQAKQDITQAISSDRRYQVSKSTQVPSFTEFNNTPHQYFDDLINIDGASLVLSGRVKEYADGYHLRFRLQGKKNAVIGEFTALETHGLTNQLIDYLQIVSTSDIASSLNKDEQVDSTLLHETFKKYPRNLVLLEQLISALVFQEQDDKALLLSEELGVMAETRNSEFYAAFSLLKQGQILASKKMFDAAGIALNQAQQLFEEQGNLRFKAKVLHAFAISYLYQQNYPQIEHYLVQAANTAKQAHESLDAVNAYTYLSILAHKFNQHKDKKEYLGRARMLLDYYRLPHEHYAVVYFHSAVFADSVEETEKHLKHIMALFPSERNHWVKSMAMTNYTHLLIEQERWSEATALYSNKSTYNQEENYLLASIYYAQAEYAQAKKHGKSAFKQTNLAGRKVDALKSALLLYQINHALEEQNEMNRYLDFVKKEANDTWIKYNGDLLVNAGLTVEELKGQL